MKILPKGLFVIGAALLLLAAVGIIVGNPSRVVGFKVTTVILGANTILLLAIIAKMCDQMCEKK